MEDLSFYKSFLIDEAPRYASEMHWFISKRKAALVKILDGSDEMFFTFSNQENASFEDESNRSGGSGHTLCTWPT